MFIGSTVWLSTSKTRNLEFLISWDGVIYASNWRASKSEFSLDQNTKSEYS